MASIVGTDIVQVKRIKDLISSSGQGFLEKHFTKEEIGYCQSKMHPDIHFAGRFAAKEAVYKCLGFKWNGNFNWKDISICSKDEKPFVAFHSFFKKKVENCGILNIAISISHCEDYAIAVAVADKNRE